MTNEELEKELSKKKFFVIRYATLINILVIILVIIFLYSVKIQNVSLIEMVLNYYFQK
jgi:hypothetical protein